MGKILVTGATGSVGRLVVDELVAAGERPRALTVNPAKAALPAEAEVVKGYLGKPQTLPAALEGIDMVYLAPLPATVVEFAKLAKEAGVRRVVTLSGEPADYEAQGDPSQWHYYAVEKAIEEAGFEWTHLRPGQFMNNTLDWADQIRTTGSVRAPYPGAVQTPIDLGDIAAVASVVLRDDTFNGRKLPMSGPEAITPPEQVAAISSALGRDLAFVELTPEEALAEWNEYMPPGVAEWLLDGFRMMSEYKAEPVSTVPDLLGRPALPYAEWAVHNADAFR